MVFYKNELDQSKHIHQGMWLVSLYVSFKVTLITTKVVDTEPLGLFVFSFAKCGGQFDYSLWKK